jgi:hypothetical protein
MLSLTRAKLFKAKVPMKIFIGYFLVRLGEIVIVKANPYRLSVRLDQALDVRRGQISKEISDSLENTIKYGCFKGAKFPNESLWGVADKACMLLGLYEKEIGDILIFLATQENNRFLVDCGAADGYFAIGTLVSKKYEHVWAFEQSQKQRKILSKNAESNQVIDSISIFGSAGSNFLDELDVKGEFDFSATTFLFDIEGAEYSILTERNLARMKESVCIIELHDFSEQQIIDRKLLLERVGNSHHGYLFRTGSRDLSEIQEISYLSDTNRWLVCSEGRPRAMDWLVLFPFNRKNCLDALGIPNYAI